MSADANAVLLGQPNRAPHGAGIGCVISAGNVCVCDEGHAAFVVAQAPDAEGFA
jgi:hypothetical protein